MRHYEIVFLVHPDQSDQVPAMLERNHEMVRSKGGQVHRSENWGRRQLAFMINDVHKAHYAMLNIECDLDTLREIERNFKFNDSIIRSLVIKRKGPITEESAMAKAKADEARAETERKGLDSRRSHVEAATDDKKSAAGSEPASKQADEKVVAKDAESDVTMVKDDAEEQK